MSCPANVVEWQVTHWMKMSRQRSLSECSNNSKENAYYGGILLQDNADINSGKNIATFRQHRKEDINPWTREWRESLRTWNYSSITKPEPIETKKKKDSLSKEPETVE